MTLNERILGGLVLAAAGDAIGAATETRSTALIEERFGGPVRDFIDAPEDTFARGAKAGTVTDDFSLAWCTAMAIAERGGVIDEACAKDALVRWHGLGDYFERYAGPTTRAAVMAMLGTPMAVSYTHLESRPASPCVGPPSVWAAQRAPAATFWHPGRGAPSPPSAKRCRKRDRCIPRRPARGSAVPRSWGRPAFLALSQYLSPLCRVKWTHLFSAGWRSLC